jgi:RNA polymerase sigma factor (sigma-70 family)
MHHLRRMIFLAGAKTLGDGELLDSFIMGRDESAFEVLVRRHGPMVQGVCRRVLGNSTDADDAFQATFLVLLRKAESIRPREKVGSWLCGVAYRCASKARSLAARRNSREVPLAEQAVEADLAFDRRDWLPLLDKELNRLPEKYRAVLVLCDLEGQSRREAATRLRLSEGTLSSRLARARALLGDRLKRRGVALSAALLVFSQAAGAAVPAALVSAAQSTLAAARAGLAVAPTISNLIHGVLNAMVVSKLLKSAAIIFVIGGLTIGLGSRSLQSEAQAQKPVPTEKPANSDNEKPAKPLKPGAEAQKPDKPAKPAVPSVAGTVTSTDDKAQTVTVRVPGAKGTKETKEETYPLAKDAQIVLYGLKKGETDKGQFGDLVAGAPVSLELTADSKAIVKIGVGGLTHHGYVASVDATKNTLTIKMKEEKQVVEKTVELIKDGKVYLDDGIFKGDKTKPATHGPKEGKLADLTEGIPVSVQLSAKDRTKAVAIRASGPTVNGTVTGVDISNNTITINSKGDGERTYPISKDVHFKGKLADIANGTPASLRLSIEDKKTVVMIVTKQE